jgi:prepilin-type N-terminal cleavage/methylation domain-containing protein
MGGSDREEGFTLIELLIVIIIIGILAAIAIPMFLSQRDKAKDSATRGGTHQIELGLASYAIDHSDTYPDAALVADGALVDGTGSAYVSPWPENPWTGTPMQHVAGAVPGHFTYVLGTPPTSFVLTGHLAAGGTFAVP